MKEFDFALDATEKFRLCRFGDRFCGNGDVRKTSKTSDSRLQPGQKPRSPASVRSTAVFDKCTKKNHQRSDQDPRLAFEQLNDARANKESEQQEN